ncbi:nuclear autoantigenic sperm protein isoform X2 [Dermochelys coriacea]|uniref:nuclear autoantigenic sperm protein isoform X2 n=2 Tax=Dermochelys coriacea TaxID=27794 RepID=UPI001CA908B2|nr:nuclear autoantigenic sperm protein isoform X2 [Dermochelys coriacea]
MVKRAHFVIPSSFHQRPPPSLSQSCRMEEELAAPSTSADKTDSMDVDGEAKKLLGLGQKHLVLGNIPAAVNAFQEAASILGKKYGETADECAEAFFYYGKSLLELARMENGVLGNALEGVQVEEEEGEKVEDDSMVENADNIDEEAREELREQVYNAMGEKEESKKSAEESPVLNEAGKETEGEDVEMGGKTREEDAIADIETKLKEKAEEQVEADIQEKTVAREQVAEATEERVEAAMEEEAVAEATEEQVEAAMEEEAVAEATEEQVEAAMEEEAVAEATEEQVEAAMEEEAVAEATEEQVEAAAEATVEAATEEEAAAEATVEAATEEEAAAEATVEAATEEEAAAEATVEAATEEEAAAEATEEQVEAATEEEAAAEATEEQVEAATEEEAAAEATEERVEAATEEEAAAEATVQAATEEEAVAEAAEEQVEAATKEKAMAEAMEEKLNKSKEALASKETLFAAGNATTPAEGKEPANEMQTEEKVEVAVKVEKERDDLMEEGDGAKVEKEEEKDDLMEEGEETEGSDEEDKENDKTEDNKENDSTIEDKESEEDEVGNLELAWDMLELAKVIYKRQETKEAQLHAAQAHLKLGEVSIESENYAQAIEEFQACLALQQKYLEAHDRLLAESHYQLALAYHYNSQFDEAILQFSKSVEVIDKRMVMLTERIKKAEGGSTEDEKEIEELNGLLPEIKEKIEDSKESQKSARVAELALKATLVGGATSSFTQSEESCSISTIPVRKPADGASQCVTDISHLVRKKRKPEEETQQGDNEAKKSKPEPAVNGGGDAAPSGNEVAEKMEEEETEKRPQVESGAAVESTV